MDYSLFDANDPTAQQRLIAEVMRRRSRTADEEALAAAHAKGHRFDLLAAATHMMNNPGAVNAVSSAQKSAVASAKPTQMGNMGFMLPESGQFIESPMYVDEKNAARQAARDNLRERLDAQAREGSERRMLQETLARMAEQGRNDRAAEMSALRMTLAGITGSRADEKAREKAETKAAENLNRDVTKYSTMLEKAGIPEFGEALEIAESRLKKHKVGELPGYGRFEGAVPNWLADSEQQMTRSDMQAAANILLKARSGAAVTDSEMRRFLTEVATGAGMTEEALRHGWENVRRQFDAKRRAITAGASPEVHDEFIKRGGKDFRVVDTPAVPAPMSDDDLINKYLPKPKGK